MRTIPMARPRVLWRMSPAAGRMERGWKAGGRHLCSFQWAVGAF